MKNVSKYLIFFIVISLGAFVVAQKKKSLSQYKKEQQKLENEINDLQSILASTKNESEASLGKVRALRELVSKRKRYVDVLNKDVKRLANTLKDSEELIDALKHDVDSLKHEYADMIYATSKMNNSFNRMFLIFSSESYNQLSLRLKLLQQFAEVKKDQVEKIQKVQSTLASEREEIAGRYEDKKRLLNKLVKEKEKFNQSLSSLEKEKRALEGKQKVLLDDIKGKKNQVEKIKDIIKKIIAEELKKSKNSKEKNVVLSKNFSSNKGRLPWPIRSKKFVSWKFGLQPNPDISGIKDYNYGIGIQTTVGSTVHASFEGEVRKILSIPGNGKTIMVKHGDFFTIYGRLENVLVKPGDVVITGQKLGTIKTVRGSNSLDFQIWQKQKNLNPQSWLSN